jgi:predicted mannosyl-3-phosphoglycerate phosphatase (HAD superfamily)
MRSAPLSRSSSQSAPASIVVITDVDGILRQVDRGVLAGARSALDVLSSGDAPVVICSTRSADELKALQRQLGIRHPFIADGGTSVHIPCGYFCGSVIPGAPDDWETIDFGARRLGHAVRLIVALYRTCPADPIVVGVGSSWHDRVLLREVDVPVVIRDDRQDQAALLRNVPHAYLTTASGGDGLSEVLLGRGSVGRA